MRVALCHHYDAILSRDVIGHVTIRLSIDDFLYVTPSSASRSAGFEILSVKKLWCHGRVWCGPNRQIA